MADKDKGRTDGTADETSVVRSTDTEEGKADVSSIRIDEDDYTDQDRAAARRKNSARKRFAEDTVANPDPKAGHSGAPIDAAMKAVVVKTLLDNHKTNRMEKGLRKGQKKFREDQERLQAAQAPGGTFGDVFAAAMAKIQLKDQEKKLQKIQEKLEKRRNRQKKFAGLMGGVLQGVNQAARTTTMQNAVGRLTANTGGQSRQDLVLPTSVDAPRASEPSDGMEY